MCPITTIYAIRFVPPHFLLVREKYQIANLLSPSFFAIPDVINRNSRGDRLIHRMVA